MLRLASSLRNCFHRLRRFGSLDFFYHVGNVGLVLNKRGKSVRVQFARQIMLKNFDIRCTHHCRVGAIPPLFELVQIHLSIRTILVHNMIGISALDMSLVVFHHIFEILKRYVTLPLFVKPVKHDPDCPVFGIRTFWYGINYIAIRLGTECSHSMLTL